MTRIRANCPACGEIDLRPEDIELHVVRSEAGQVGEGSNYTFACPTCTEHVVKPADERIARLLATGGVPVSITTTGNGSDSVRTIEMVATEPHPEAPPSGTAFTYDDILDFHQLLDSDDWFQQLTR